MAQTLQIIEDVNGVDMLFQTESAYLPNTLTVIEQKEGTGSRDVRTIEQLSNMFFKIDPAPENLSDLYCYYEIAEEDPIGTDSLSPWEKANIEKMMSIIAYQEQTLKNMEAALHGKVNYSDFASYVEVMEKQMADIQATLLP